MIISQRLLKRIGACKDQYLLFKKTFPGGKVAVTGENLQKAHTAGLNLAWLLEHLPVENGYAWADFACRVAAPFALRKVGLSEQADKLEALQPIVDQETANTARDTAWAARAAAGDAWAAGAAARAAWAAARAAEAAARAAEAAARAAEAAARAAGDAAWAAWAAAWAAWAVRAAAGAAEAARDADVLPIWNALAELINQFVKESAEEMSGE